jgi:hypothetical protein
MCRKRHFASDSYQVVQFYPTTEFTLPESRYSPRAAFDTHWPVMMLAVKDRFSAKAEVLGSDPICPLLPV